MQFTVACIQLNAQEDLGANVAAAEKLIREAARAKVQFIALPENALYMREPGGSFPASYDEALSYLALLARELSVWLLIGSIHPQAAHEKAWNRSVLINEKGGTVAQYDKIHLFDVTLANGETYRESDRMQAGDKAVIARTPWGKLGMTVCYDVRFPQLYRALAHAGAEFFSVPSAFTYTTGSAHWHTLLRARAIENGAYIIAPAQCGTHPGKRRTWGHSLIVDPWGSVIAEGSEDKPGIITATIDTAKVAEARASLPSLTHDRQFTIKS